VPIRQRRVGWNELSTVTTNGSEAALTLPAASVAVAVMVCSPLASAKVVMLKAPVMASAVAVPRPC
jgi:hypothetical protein